MLTMRLLYRRPYLPIWQSFPVPPYPVSEDVNQSQGHVYPFSQSLIIHNMYSRGHIIGIGFLRNILNRFMHA
jgi:hypothetical protein